MKRLLGWSLFLTLSCSTLSAYHQGYMDTASCSVIEGWAWETTLPNTPVSVDLFENGLPIGTILANVFRADLLAAGKGNGYHGFSLPTPNYLKDGQWHELKGRVNGTTVNLSNYSYLNCSPGSYGYQPYYSDTLTSINSSNWDTNGSVSGTSGGLTATSTNGGSVISKVAVPDATSDYEVQSTVTLASFSGTYVTYLRASSDALSGSSSAGTYYAVELAPTSSGGACSAGLTFSKRVSGSITSLASSTVICHSGMVIRATLNGGSWGIYVDNQFSLYAYDTAITTGKPGIGARGTPTGNSIALVNLGPQDRTAPTAVSGSSIGTSSFATTVDLQWQGAPDNSNGTGLAYYYVMRDSVLIGLTASAEFHDYSLAPSTSYSYMILPADYHMNIGGGTTVTVTTPPTGSVDPRRVGVRPTGAYWGGGGENIDLLSGNLNFSLPLIKATARSGWGVSFNLTYNSQNWRADGSLNWNLGRDVGYGYGWKLLAGSLTPYWQDFWTLHHYIFTDATGAEYRLDQNSGGVWSSKESLYVYYDSNVGRLYFRDGSFWVFGATSAGTEQDAGTMYPTVFQDTNGNQILVRYYPGQGLGWLNSSARIRDIDDVRTDTTSAVAAYAFLFDTASPPHLLSIENYVNTGEHYTFALSGQTLTSPFSSTTWGTTRLDSVQIVGNGLTNAFTYNSAGEITKITFPYGGWTRYTYADTTYPGSRHQDEIANRYVSKDGSTETGAYAFSHESSTGTLHAYTLLNDAGGVGQKYWAFATSGTYQGLATSYEGHDRSTTTNHCNSGSVTTAVCLVENAYTWTQDSVGNSYINSVLTTADKGQTGYEAAKKTTQTLDVHGNVTQVETYEYGNVTTTPNRTDTYTYLSSSGYTSRYIFNRLSTGPNSLSISYDQTSLGTPPSDAHEWDSSIQSVTARGNPTTITTVAGTKTVAYDFAGGVVSSTQNGITVSNSTSNATNYAAPDQISVGSLDTTMSYSFLALTGQTGPNSASVSFGYDAMARPNSSTSAFGATTTTTYNDTAYPVTSPTLPPSVTSTINGRKKITTLDGFGRPIKVEANDGTNTLSVSESEYEPCGCSPMGKLSKTSLPHDPSASGTAITWTTYTYDGIGRTLSTETKTTATTPDTKSKTTYEYHGNTVTVTDATTTRWKKHTTNAFGQLVEVEEPNPAGSGTHYFTTYEYDSLGHLKTVSMPRGSSTQTRSFNYGTTPGALLLDATNPENGMVTYSYNSDKTLAEKVDAKGQHVQYSYDSYKRVTQVRRGTWGNIPSTVVINAQRWGTGADLIMSSSTLGSIPSGYDSSAQDFTLSVSGNLSTANLRVSYADATPYTPWVIVNSLTLNGNLYSSSSHSPLPTTTGYTWYEFSTASAWSQPVGLQEDTCQREDYSYDTNPYDSTFSSNTLGRLAAVRYKGGYNASASPTCDITFTEMYSYNSAGALLKKRLRVTRGSQTFDLDGQYTFDNEGRMTAVQYPSTWNGSSWVAGPNLGNSFDAMGRLKKLTDLTASSDLISNTTYYGSGQVYQITGVGSVPSETRVYNSLGQLTDLTNGSLHVQYAYHATQNNGKITSETDAVSGETVTYTYDLLNRLASAASSVTPGWGQSYAYDGFGNLTTQTVTQGTAPSLSVTFDPATNRRTSECADANGNLNSYPGCSGGNYFDIENRMVRNSGTLAWAYSYAPGNKRVWRGVWSGSTQTVDEITYWGANGQKLVTYQLNVSGSSLVATSTGAYQYFGGKLIKNAGGYVTPDRLGSIGKYFPYGQERPSATTDGKEKFATYFRDSETGLDYAQNRYHSPGQGRFLTADPYVASGGAEDPSSWNRYAYVGGDPVNRSDPRGLYWVYSGMGNWCSTISGACMQYGCFDNPAACVDSLGHDDGTVVSGVGGGGCPEVGNSLYGGGGCFGPRPEPIQPSPPEIIADVQCNVELLEQSIIANGVPFMHTIVRTTRQTTVGGVTTTQIDTYEGVSASKSNPTDIDFGLGIFFNQYWLNQFHRTGFNGVIPATAYQYMSTQSVIWSTGMSTENCGYTALIGANAAGYRPGTTTYNLLLGFNSNSWTYTLLHKSGLQPDVGILSHPGWGKWITTW